MKDRYVALVTLVNQVGCTVRGHRFIVDADNVAEAEKEISDGWPKHGPFGKGTSWCVEGVELESQLSHSEWRERYRDG